MSTNNSTETTTDAEIATWFYSLDIQDRLRLAQVREPRLLDILVQEFRLRERTHQAHTVIGSLYLAYYGDELIGTQSPQPFADVECTPAEVALMASLRFSYDVSRDAFDGLTVRPSFLSARDRTFLRTVRASAALVPAPMASRSLFPLSDDDDDNNDDDDYNEYDDDDEGTRRQQHVTHCMGYAEFDSMSKTIASTDPDWQPLRYVMVVRAIAARMYRRITRAFLRRDGSASSPLTCGSSEGDRLRKRLAELLGKAVTEHEKSEVSTPTTNSNTLRHILEQLSAQLCGDMERKELLLTDPELMDSAAAVVSPAQPPWDSGRALWAMFSFASVDPAANVLKMAFLKSAARCLGPQPPSEPHPSFFRPGDTLQLTQRQPDPGFLAFMPHHRRAASFSSPSPTESPASAAKSSSAAAAANAAAAAAGAAPNPASSASSASSAAAAPTAPPAGVAPFSGPPRGSRDALWCNRSGSTSPILFDESSQCSSEVASSYSACSDGSDTDSACGLGFGLGFGMGLGGFNNNGDFSEIPPSREPWTHDSNSRLPGFGFLKTAGTSSSEASPFSSTFGSDAPSDSDEYSSGTATPDIPAASPTLSLPSSPHSGKHYSASSASSSSSAAAVGAGAGAGAGAASGLSLSLSSARKDPALNGALGSAGFYKCDPAEDLPDWCTTPYRGDPSGFLSLEIGDYVAYLDNIFRDGQHIYENTIRGITAAIERHLPGARLHTFGSYATGLCIPSSDLDLVCCIPEENIQRPFRLLSRALRDEPWVAQLKAIETAAFPVIKFITRDSEIPVDISFDCKPPSLYQLPPYARRPAAGAGAGAGAGGGGGGGAFVPPGNAALFGSRHRGLQAAELVTRFLRSTPKLRPLVIVLKQFLFERELNKPYTGGLGSFCLLLMVKAFLNIYDRDGAVLDTGGALTAFLRCYGVDFDYARMGISMKHGGTHFNIGDPGYCKYMGAALTIEDPFDPMNNIGASSFNMIRVKQAFAEAFYSLTGKNNVGTPTILSRIMQL